MTRTKLAYCGRRLRVLFLVLALPAASRSDVPPKAPSSVDASKLAHQRTEAEKNYRCGVQYAEGNGVPKITPRRRGSIARRRKLATRRLNMTWRISTKNGFGLAQDWQQAAFWYRKSAEQGDAEAQNNLGALYAKGQGVPQSDAEALHWYRLAAEQNDPEGISNLGTMYLQGRAVECDYDQAFKLFLKAANLGYAVAQNNLALMYANGEAVDKDYAWAYAWLDIAATQIAGCAELRDRITAEMTPVEIARAHNLANGKREELTQKNRDAKR